MPRHYFAIPALQPQPAQDELNASLGSAGPNAPRAAALLGGTTTTKGLQA
jgi:hypothetical protein